MTETSIESDRLLLRRWRQEDREPFAALNADPEVMEYFPAPLSRPESDALVARLEAQLEERGFGFWALEVKATGEFIGFTGISIPGFEAPFMPTVEIGWRLSRGAWGQGFASEAAERSAAYGFGELDLPEIVSFTYEGNRRSRAVMERLGMVRDPTGDFDHPPLVGHRLAPHVLYRLPADRWRAR